MSSRLIVITDSDLPGDNGVASLRAAGFDVHVAQAKTPEDVIRDASGAAGLIVQWASITDEVFEALPGLEFVSRLGIGYDSIDVAAASRRGIAVANTPTYCVEEVATHTIAMLLSLARSLPHYDRAMRAGTWAPVDARPLAARPSTQTVAVLGFGRIGSRVARAASALGFKVVVHDAYQQPEQITAAGLEPVTLAEALEVADFLSLHLPLNDSTQHLLNRDSLASAKDGVVVINTCRGGLIDESALIEALETGKVAAAALDVYEHEPLAEDDRLLALDNVLLSPHAAWYSGPALLDLPEHAARNIIDYFAGAPVPSIVNPDRSARADHVQAG